MDHYDIQHKYTQMAYIPFRVAVEIALPTDHIPAQVVVLRKPRCV